MNEADKKELIAWIKEHKVRAVLRIVWLIPYLIYQFLYGFVLGVREELKRRRS